jgi:hypothetical protein
VLLITDGFDWDVDEVEGAGATVEVPVGAGDTRTAGTEDAVGGAASGGAGGGTAILVIVGGGVTGAPPWLGGL